MGVPGAVSQEVLLHNAAVAVGNGTTLAMVDGERKEAYTTVTVDIDGITTATITFEAQINSDGDWRSVALLDLSDGSTYSSTATSDGLYQGVLVGVKNFRARISAWTSGTITVIARKVA